MIADKIERDIVINNNTQLPSAPDQEPYAYPWCEYSFDDILIEKRCLCDSDPQEAIAQGIDCRVYNQVYFYHPDYVGSVEFITDLNGFINQFYHYAPYGEVITSHNAQSGFFNVNSKYMTKNLSD